jgi:drug/metabolite transporter (DMT)-like permease
MSTVTIDASDGSMPWKGLLSALAVVGIWSGFVVVSRAGGVSPLTPWDVIAIRYATAASLLLPFWWARRRFRLWNRRYVVLAACGGLAYAVLAFSGFKLTSAAHAAVLLPGLLPFAVALAACALLGEVPGVARWAGLALAACGIGCLGAEASGVAGSAVAGDFLVIGAAAGTCLLLKLRSPSRS